MSYPISSNAPHNNQSIESYIIYDPFVSADLAFLGSQLQEFSAADLASLSK
jgi:hypothetical protein